MQHDKAVLESRLYDLDTNLFMRTDRSSKKRIVRAIEIAETCRDSGRTVEFESPVIPAFDKIVLRTTWERKLLYKRIDRRLSDRLEQGLIDEVKRLLDSGISPQRFALFGMEYRHVARYIRQEVEYAVMVEELRRDIHHLAKRQETWFRGMERRGIPMLPVPEADPAVAIPFVERFLNSSRFPVTV
jgi:tRNA dimethylallyltransferase